MKPIKFSKHIIFFVLSVFLTSFSLYAADGKGASGTFVSLPGKTTYQDVDAGVKIFRYATGADADLEYAVFNYIQEALISFRKLIGESGPEWWKNESPISKFMLDKDTAQTLDENIETFITNQTKTLTPQNSEGYGEHVNWLFMQDFSKYEYTTFKVSKISENLVKINSFAQTIISSKSLTYDQQKLVIEIYNKIGEAFLLMFFLGVVINDCDLFLIHDKFKKYDRLIDSIDVKFIDFGTSRVFTKIESNKLSVATGQENLLELGIAGLYLKTVPQEAEVLKQAKDNYEKNLITGITNTFKSFYAITDDELSISKKNLMESLVLLYKDVLSKTKLAFGGTVYEKALISSLLNCDGSKVATELEKIKEKKFVLDTAEFKQNIWDYIEKKVLGKLDITKTGEPDVKEALAGIPKFSEFFFDKNKNNFYKKAALLIIDGAGIELLKLAKPKQDVSALKTENLKNIDELVKNSSQKFYLSRLIKTYQSKLFVEKFLDVNGDKLNALGVKWQTFYTNLNKTDKKTLYNIAFDPIK